LTLQVIARVTEKQGSKELVVEIVFLRSTTCCDSVPLISLILPFSASSGVFSPCEAPSFDLVFG
jgi:hypothetical protein